MPTKRPSSSQYKRTSRQLRGAVLGTHMGASRYANIGSRGFSNSNARRQRSAVRGEIHQVLPHTATRETRQSYENRMSQRDYIERSIATGRRRMALMAGALALVIAIAAAIVAVVVFFQGIDARMQLDDPELKAALAEPAEEGTATYMLLAASFDEQDDTDPDCLVLVRTDPETGIASALGIPANASARFSDGQVRRVGEAVAFGGNAELVKTVEAMFDVQISHLATTDAQGFIRAVDALDGLVVDLPEEIKDPDAGSLSLKAGVQTLSGEQALFACRANDYLTSAEQTRGTVEGLVASAFFQRLAGVGAWSFYGMMDELSASFKTDMDVRSAYDYLKSLSSIPFDGITTGALPTYLSKVDGVEYQVPIADEVKNMMQRIRAGEAPQAAKGEVLSSVDPASVTITLNNGGTVEGAAGEAKELLEAAGFKPGEAGNATQAVYDETLVIYSDGKFESAAEAIVATLGAGRAVWDSVHYSFDTDVLIMVGNDWQAVRDAAAEKRGKADAE